MSKYARRIDANQNEIVAQLRDLGASVAIMSAVGKGCPDLLVGYRGKNYLFEIKDHKKPKCDRKLTTEQIKFHSKWHGQIMVITTIDEAIQIITGS